MNCDHGLAFSGQIAALILYVEIQSDSYLLKLHLNEWLTKTLTNSFFVTWALNYFTTVSIVASLLSDKLFK
jgi:hypothetical protein